MAFHLIDSRHNPTDLDIELNLLLRDKLIPYVVLLSKTDKLKQSELAAAKKEIRGYFPELSYGDNLFAYSAFANTGHKEVQNLISSLFLRE